MFALAAPGKLVELLEDAAFFDIETHSVSIGAPLHQRARLAG